MFRTETRPRAQKQHECESCGRTIEPGETYNRCFGTDAGECWTYKECLHCAALARLWDLYEYTYEEGYTRETFQEFGRDIARLDQLRDARWYVQWCRKWRRRDGTLYPIPTIAQEQAA